MSAVSRHESVAVGVDPIAGLSAILRDYFAARHVGAVRDPWAHLLDGMLMRVHITRWPGRVRLSADDFGLEDAAYERLAGKVRWGTLDLLPDALGGELDSVATLARGLVGKWGRQVHWGTFVPLSAMPKLREEWDGLRARWDAALDSWIADYAAHRRAACDRAALFAAQSYRVACQMQHARVCELALDAFIDVMVPRLMADYPEAAKLRERFTMAYDLAFIPTPTLEAEQAAHAERVAQANADRLAEMRRQADQAAYEDERERLRLITAISEEEAKHAEKLRLVREFAEETRQQLQATQTKLLDEFYRGYALDIRQRLHESLMLLVEGVQAGKIRPQATRSLRVVLDEIKYLALDDDSDIQQLQERLRELLEQEDISAAAIRQDVIDLGVILQTSILALGETPRVPRRMHAPPLDVAGMPEAEGCGSLRERRERLAFGPTLAEALLAAPELVPSSLRRARGLSIKRNVQIGIDVR